jgi:zinc protease
LKTKARQIIRHCFFVPVFFLLLLAAPAHAKIFNAESFTLDNGLQVVVIPNHRAPVVTHSVWYKVGAADEPQGLSGMAHYFEHLMFKGTETVPPGVFSTTVKKLGGQHNAFTGHDYTAYYENISVEHLERMMKMEADRMVNLSVPPEHFQSEKQVVLEERRQRTDNNPVSLFTEQMKSHLFVNHNYGRPVIGWFNEIEGYEWEDVKKFYDAWYAPNNAIVVISGDITAKEVKPVAERTYGKLKPKELPPRKRTEVVPAIAETEMTLNHSSIHQPSLRQIFLAPNYKDNKQDALALQVLDEILSGGATTRLYKNLVVVQKKAISVGITYQGDAIDKGTIWIGATPAKDITLEELKNLIHAEIQDVIKNGVTKKETDEAIQRLQDSAVFARDSLQGPAMIFGYALANGGTIDDVENWSDDIAKVTPQAVQAAAAKYLDIKDPWIRPPVTGYLLPEYINENPEDQKSDKQQEGEKSE